MRRRFTSKRGININDYLTIEALEDKVSISFHDMNYVNTPEYCIDASGVWNRMYDNVDVIINTNQTLSLRGEMVESGNGVGQISIDGICNLRGNCMSLIYKDNAADNLELGGVSFRSLFGNCDGIKEVSKNFLPATTLGFWCYYGTFSECTSLTTAPELPATTLARYCYRDMFSGCEKLNYIKMLATDISADSCLDSWVYGVASTGTFVKSKDATWDVVGVNGVPSGWTVITDDQEGGL